MRLFCMQHAGLIISVHACALRASPKEVHVHMHACVFCTRLCCTSGLKSAMAGLAACMRCQYTHMHDRRVVNNKLICCMQHMQQQRLLSTRMRITKHALLAAASPLPACRSRAAFQGSFSAAAAPTRYLCCTNNRYSSSCCCCSEGLCPQ